MAHTGILFVLKFRNLLHGVESEDAGGTVRACEHVKQVVDPMLLGCYFYRAESFPSSGFIGGAFGGRGLVIGAVTGGGPVIGLVSLS